MQHVMGSKKSGYIDKFLKKADKAIQEGVKKADEVLEEAVELGSMTAKQASKTSKDLHSQAKKESETLQKRGIAKINDGISTAKKVTSNTHDDLEVLEKLGRLRKTDVITEEEFKAKKKKILDRI
jgi:polyhydroxyalkanoate synthesis regulator phasin